MQKPSKIKTATACAMVLVSLLLIALVSGCGTITPPVIHANEASFDNSTPPQYDNQSSGWLGFVTNDRGETVGGLITKNAANRWDALISAYRLQFKEEKKIELNAGAGVKPQTDQYGNAVFFIDSQHLQYFLKLSRWSRAGRAVDSLWLKLKEKVS